ncbi:MAG: hypothetical protein IJK84_03360 [Bacteroidales bacterium]|nr:hypothetical protein [Bacteroidales bacterium]
MRRTVIAIASALLVLAAASCKKDTEKNEYSDRPVRFTATIEGSQNGKTQLVGHDLKWQNGDMVAVVCPEFGTKEMYTPNAAGSTHAEFVYAGNMDDEPTLSTPITAAYPADYWSDDLGTITLSCHQNYVADGMEKFPMYGVGEEGRYGVDFKNVCGVLRVRLVKPGENVTKIAVTSTTYLNGTFGVSMNSEGLPEMEHVSGGTNGDTLLCAEPVSINTATDFYIYLPAGSYNPLRIEIFNDRGLLCSMESTVAINIERNKITTIAPPADKLEFAIVAGLISVSDTQQVRFATGNLQYVRATNSFQFASSQYEVFNVPFANSDTRNPVITTDPIVDMFYFSEGASNNYGASVLTTSLSTTNFVDWAESLGSDNTEGWRTLSAAEWNYALNSQNFRKWYWGYAVITDGDDTLRRGLVLVPDGWTSQSFKYWGSTNMVTSDWNHARVNNYSVSEWSDLEKIGVVFLPGYLADQNYTGHYWTSSNSATVPTNWQFLNLRSHGMQSTGINYGGPLARAVRLAKNYEPLVITGSSSTGLK